MSTPTTPTSLLHLHTHQPLLIDLHFTLHWAADPDSESDPYYYSQTFPPVAFAADIITTTTTTPCSSPEINPSAFLTSLDEACLDRIRAMTRYTAYDFTKPVNYEVERWFVWDGIGSKDKKSWGEGEEGAKVGMRGLSAVELEAQLKMVRTRGYRDWVRVEMQVEIEPGVELGKRGRVEEVEGLGWEEVLKECWVGPGQEIGGEEDV